MADHEEAAGKLHGWKEIASHFDRTPRTVQRWEREFGLPVHRIGLGKGEVVYALRSEIEEWARRRQALPPAEGGENGSEPHVAGPGGADAGGRPEQAELAEARGPGPALVPATPPGRPAWHRWAGAALLAGAALAILAAWRLTPAGPPPVPTRAVVEASTLRALAADGRELWSYRFDHAVVEDSYSNPTWAIPRPLHFADLEGDGTREVLALALYSDARRGYELLCFEADGRKRFSWSPTRSVTYGKNTWSAPFRVYSAIVSEVPRTLWVSAVHHLYFPSVVAKLDPQGRVHSEFWANGHVTLLEFGRFRGHRAVFAGGANNEFKSAGLVVIDRQDASGSTPATNPAYRCLDCPPGEPLASLVFPVPDLLARTGEGGIASVTAVLPNDGGGFSVAVGYPLPLYGNKDGTPLQGAFYEFDEELRPIRGEFSAQYVAAHRRAEEEGLLDHRYDEAVEERQLFPILAWNGSAYVPVSPEGW